MAGPTTEIERRRKLARSGFGRAAIGHLARLRRLWPVALTGIRLRLMLLAVLALVPLTFDRVRVLDASRLERLNQTTIEATDLVRRGAEGQHEVMVTIRSVLQAVARAYPIAAKAQSCSRFLDGFIRDIPWVTSLSVLGKNGRIACSTNPAAVSLNASDRDYFHHVVEEQTFIVSDYLLTRSAQTPSIIAAYPIESGGEDAVAVIAPVNLAWIGRLSNASAGRRASAMLLVDSKGNIIAHHPNPTKWIGINIADHPLFKRLEERGRGSFTATDIDGARRIFSFASVPWTDAKVAIGLDERTVLQDVDAQILSAYVQLALFAFLTLVAFWFLGERLIVNPVRALTRKAIRFGRGDLDSRFSREVWASEFAPLATALDDMAHKLAAREQELQSANRHLTALASSDSLSGLANRRAFDMRLDTAWQATLKSEESLALLMIDVDYFKLFNDRYGHLEGDKALRFIAGALASIGAAGFAARYGGEEFAFLIPGGDIDTGIAMAERLRRDVEAGGFAHAEAPTGYLTISVGVAAFVPQAGEAPERLIEAADIALYAAKRRGRNCAVAHAPLVFAEAG